MTAEQFAYWLQGFAELNEGPPSAEQWQSVREHLATVFVKVTPPVTGPIIGVPYQRPRIAQDDLIRPLTATCLASGDGDTYLVC